MKPCTRFRDDGSACTNQTDYADGWCRLDDCHGFLRPDPTQAAMSKGSPQGTAKHIRQTGNLPTGDVSVEDVPTIRVTKRAIESFRLHHGGGKREAEVQLRSMLEDLLLKSARSVSSGGFLKLAREGYVLILSPDRDMIANYFTVHRERTWEQVKAGVKSRFKKLDARDASGPPPERGPLVALSDFDAAFDSHTVHLTARARTSCAKNAGLQQVSDEELDATIRGACAEFESGSVSQRDDGCFEINQADRIWLVSPDCRSLYNVKNSGVSLDLPGEGVAFEAAHEKAKKTSNKARRSNAKSAKSPSEQSKHKKKSKSKLDSDLREYWEDERAKDERIDHRPNSPYLGIYSVKSVASGGLPGHGKRR